MADLNDHAARVERWLNGAAKSLSEERRLSLFEHALAAVWRRAHVTLGAVTLGAVTERVLHFATEKYPHLSSLRVDGDGVHLDELTKRGGRDRDMTPPLRFVLVELLTVLGNLTDEVITPALHAELAKVKPGRRKGGSKTRRSKGPRDEGASS